MRIGSSSGQKRADFAILATEAALPKGLVPSPYLQTPLTPLEQERRAHPRVAAPELPLKLAGEGAALRVRDISQSGVAFFADNPVALMTKVRFEVELPSADGKGRPIVGEGAVVRCERLSPALGHYEVAVFFQHLEGNSLRDLKDYLDQALT